MEPSRTLLELVGLVLQLLLVILLFVAPYVALVLLARDVWRLLRPQRRLLQGRYGDARIAAEILTKSWLRVFPSVRRSSEYTMALALHLEGRHEEALAIVERLAAERLDRNLSYAVHSLEGGIRVFLRLDPARAVVAMNEAARVRRSPEDDLILANALLASGRPDEAAKAFARAETTAVPGTALGRTVLRTIPRLRETMSHTLRAMYLLETGADAHADLAVAAASPDQNAYSLRARELLPDETPGDDEGPPSLAPHVVG